MSSPFTSTFTARKRSFRRLCFYTCLSVILFTGWGVSASVHAGIHPLGQTPPEQTPPGRHPPGRYPLGRHPLGRHPHPGRHPPGQTAPWEMTPPRSRLPPPPVQCILGDTGNKLAVPILLECILV